MGKEAIVDRAPFDAARSTATTIGVDGKATVTGAGTLRTRIFITRVMRAISFFVSGTGSGVGAAAGGTPATAWKMFACNDYDPTRPNVFPGSFVDVTADIGAVAGASTPPGTKQFNGAVFSGAISDRMASPECPYSAVYFEYTNASGTEIVTGAFEASEV